jgi:hypothetical protein
MGRNRLSLESLLPISDGAGIGLVVDDETLCQELQSRGVPTELLRPEFVPTTQYVVLVLSNQPVTQAVRSRFADVATLLVPAVAFDPGRDAVRYTLEVLLATDFKATCQRNSEWVDLLRWQRDGQLRFAGSGTELICRLRDNLSVHTCLEVALHPGEWVSIADYCEVSLTPPSTKDWDGAFTIDGTARATGVLVAQDSRVDRSGLARIEKAKRLRDEFVRSQPIDLEMREGTLVALYVAGADRLGEVLEATNPAHGLHAVELGLGSNLDIAGLVDWAYNSQMNEGAAPLHLGFGEGITGAHMDFVLEGAALVTTP